VIYIEQTIGRQGRRDHDTRLCGYDGHGATATAGAEGGAPTVWRLIRQGNPAPLRHGKRRHTAGISGQKRENCDEEPATHPILYIIDPADEAGSS
jgi:hypothetical protein